jgi:hypothetical protein
MKILWSWSQQPCSSQLTAISSGRRRRSNSSALRLEFGGRGGRAGGGAQHGSSEWKLPGALWKRAGLRAQEPRERWAGGCGVCPRRVWAERF